MRTTRHPQAVYWTLRAGDGFSRGVFTTSAVVYYVTVIHLNPLELVLAGTVMEVACLAVQVPTGAFADAVSRRLSVIVGFLFMGVGRVLQGLFPAAGAVFAGQAVWGIGTAFTDGATQAWVSGELGDENLGHLFLRGTQVEQVAYLVGVPSAALLGLPGITVPVIASGGVLLVLAAVLIVVMGETRRPAQPRSRGAGVADAVRQSAAIVRSRPILLRAFGVIGFIGISGEGFDRLWTAHFLDDLGLAHQSPFSALTWIALVNLGSILCALAALEAARRITRRPAVVVKVLKGSIAAGSIALLAFGAVTSVWAAIVFFCVTRAYRYVSGALYSAWITRLAPTAIRATVLSLSGQVESLGAILGGPLVGVVGQLFSLRAAIVSSGVLLAPAIPLCSIKSEREKSRRT